MFSLHRTVSPGRRSALESDKSGFKPQLGHLLSVGPEHECYTEKLLFLCYLPHKSVERIKPAIPGWVLGHKLRSPHISPLPAQGLGSSLVYGRKKNLPRRHRQCKGLEAADSAELCSRNIKKACVVKNGRSTKKHCVGF